MERGGSKIGPFIVLATVLLAVPSCDGKEGGDAAVPDKRTRDSKPPVHDGHPTDASGPTRDGPAPSHLALAARWAPVWYQDTDSSDYKADYIVAYDFDGDTRSDNNWENLKKSGVDLSAVIYYTVVETQTHWFITYTDFHPRDWKEHCYQPVPSCRCCATKTTWRAPWW